MKKNKKKIELLAPAGDLKKLKFAIEYGADAVYCGLPNFSLRSMIKGFDLKNLKKGIEYAHKLKKKVYLTLNIYPHGQQLEKLPDFIKKMKVLKPDALIISDPGILLMLKKAWPNIEIHLSTQANCTNWQAAKFWYDNGVKRIILARETTLKDIKEIHEKVPQVELEYFVHGAMCVSYSGRCLLSSWFNNRSANLGACTQPCRWNYKLYLQEEKRPNNFFPINQDEHGTYIMNSKDLCLIEHLDKLKKVGITSFKIEGRAKSFYYTALVVSAYRQALEKKEKVSVLKKELEKLPNRGFTTGFLLGKETVEQRFESSHSGCEWELCGEVVRCENANNENDMKIFVKVKVHNSMKEEDQIEISQPNGEKIKMKIINIFNEDKQKIPNAHGGQDRFVYLAVKKKVPKMSLIRKKLK